MVAQSAKRILILGGGFGGLYTALELEKALGRDSSIRVTLVNRENFFLFTPMLHEIAASNLDFTHIVNPIRKLLSKVEFFHGEVRSIDLRSRRVEMPSGMDSTTGESPGEVIRASSTMTLALPKSGLANPRLEDVSAVEA